MALAAVAVIEDIEELRSFCVTAAAAIAKLAERLRQYHDAELCDLRVTEVVRKKGRLVEAVEMFDVIVARIADLDVDGAEGDSTDASDANHVLVDRYEQLIANASDHVTATALLEEVAALSRDRDMSSHQASITRQRLTKEAKTLRHSIKANLKNDGNLTLMRQIDNHLDEYDELIANASNYATAIALMEEITTLSGKPDLSSQHASTTHQRLVKEAETLRQSLRANRKHDDTSMLMQSIDDGLEGLTNLFEVEKCIVRAATLEQYAEQLSAVRDLADKDAKATCEELGRTHIQLRTAVSALPRIERLSDLMNRVDTHMLGLGHKLERDVLEAKEAEKLLSGGGGKIPPVPVPRTKFKLDLPKFDGTVVLWNDFWEMFDRLISSAGLSDIEKTQHLLQSMQSEEGAAIVRCSSNAGYHQVVKELQTRFGRPREVYAEHVRALNHQPELGDDREEVIKRKQLIAFHVQGINKCCEEKMSLSHYLVAVTQETMKDKMAAKWADYTDEMQTPPALEDLNAFLEKRISALGSNPRNLKKSHKPSEVPRNRQSRPTSPHRPFHAKHEATAYLAREDRGSRGKCYACDGQHYIYHCPTFKSWDVVRRTSEVADRKLCPNCLNPGHGVATCKSKYQCKECAERHNTLLHRSAAAPPPPTNSVLAVHSMQSRKEQSFCRTAIVSVNAGVYSRTARVLMDHGSTVTLITSKLANRLRARKRESSTIVHGLRGVVNIRHEVEVNLGAVHGQNEEDVTVTAQVMDTITAPCPANRLKDVKSMPFLQNLQLADPHFDTPGHIDILLGIKDCGRCCATGERRSNDKMVMAKNTIFGWVVGGATAGPSSVGGCRLITTSQDQSTAEMLQLIWEMEKVPGEPAHLDADEQVAISHFEDTYSRDDDGRYRVQLPRKIPTPELGKSRFTAKRRYLQNQRSLMKKGGWSDFVEAVQEYPDLAHAELVPEDEVMIEEKKMYYLPMHGVIKESSETTKLRVVFDASAKTSTGVSLNDTLLKGPSLYPHLTTILNRFRLHRVGIAADISKMFREIGLHDSEKDFHRFFMEKEGELVDYRMTRLTFGVTPSPFLATKVLHQLASDYGATHPAAADAIRRDFYVDDLLSGAQTVEKAGSFRKETMDLFERAKMTIRKWISNSAEFMAAVPPELRAKDDSSVSITPASCTKTLGVHWNTVTDSFHISCPTLEDVEWPTKRQVASAVAKTFDVDGWFSPATVTIKILLQELWRKETGWDDAIPVELLPTWIEWKTQLPVLTSHPIPRYVADTASPIIDRQLHGFSDASTAAYGGVVYLRLLHEDASVSIRLISSKTKLAPMPGNTIPRMELCGAHVLSKLLTATASDLNVPIEHVYAWCDSAVVLGWLNKPVSSLLVFVANRVRDICQLVPSEQWRYVATNQNPADFASRGLMPQELLKQVMWWKGPPWLSRSPDEWPRRPDINFDRELPDLRNTVLLISATEEFHLWKAYSNYDRLVRVVSWVRRYLNKRRRQSAASTLVLSSDELASTRTFLFRVSQEQSFPEALEKLKKGQDLARGDPLRSVEPMIGEDGLLRLRGRIDHADEAYDVQHPIILDRRSWLTKMLVKRVHLNNNHAGPSAMLGILASSYYIKGIKKLTKSISYDCITCKRVYAKTTSQLMGQLPVERIKQSPPFTVVGLDFAGPFLIKSGAVRRPTKTKAYACIFVCFSTRAVHIEVVSDLSTESFKSTLQRFVGRRGCPATIYSDNGTNFRGAWRELSEIQKYVQEQGESEGFIHHFAATHHISWQFSPSRAPHFGGLWEAAVKSMKILLRKTIGRHLLSFEELTTVLVEAEATLNSRPLVATDSMPTDGSVVLTAGHFLIGRPLRAVPIPVDVDSNVSSLRRWNLLQRLQTDLWRQWKNTYLAELNRRVKWRRPKANIRVGDLVMIKDGEYANHSWPIGLVETVYPGADGLVRAADVRINGKTYRRPIVKMVILSTVEQLHNPAPGRMFGLALSDNVEREEREAERDEGDDGDEEEREKEKA